MPKIVDHAARREELARSVLALVGREGIEAATVRRVAAESGWSMGAVRHYFATQQELLAFAGEIMAQRVGERIAGLYAGVDARDAGPRAERLDRACLVLEQLLPMDEERAVEVVVWLAFMTRARTDPGLDGLRQQGWAGERFVCRSAVADACGLPLPTSLDARLDGSGEKAVDRLQVGVEGLSLIASTHPEHWPADAQRAAVRRLLLDACREVDERA